jgi:hypothetical protein
MGGFNEVVAVCTEDHGTWKSGDQLGISLTDDVLSIVLCRKGKVIGLGPLHLPAYFRALYDGALEIRKMIPAVHHVARLALACSELRQPLDGPPPLVVLPKEVA